jgi:hypothetical protein
VNVVFLGEAGYELCLVLIEALLEVTGETSIESAALVCHYVDIIGFHTGIVMLSRFDGQIPPLAALGRDDRGAVGFVTD